MPQKFHIQLGDCVLGMKSRPAQSIDVVVTSPPYNLDIQYGVYDDNKPFTDYLKWCDEWSAQVRRVLRQDGSFFLNLGESKDPFFAFEVAKRVGKQFVLQNTIHWIKSISIEREGDQTSSYGHFKPINSQRYLNDCHEYVFHFTPEGVTKLNRLAIGVPYQDKSNIDRWGHTNGKDKRCRGNTWFIPYKTIRHRDKQRPHPATFPTELAVKCIRLHGGNGLAVLDPFLGIGHSALAAKKCQDMVSEFVGFDIDEEYLKVACGEAGCSYSKVSQKTPRVLCPSPA